MFKFKRKTFENLFLTSSYNQLKKSLIFCEKNNLTNNAFVFFGRKGNLDHFRTFKQENNKLKLIYIPLSFKPNRIRTLKYIYFMIIFKLINKIIASKKIFFFNCMGYNNIFAKIYKNQCEMNLIEDGLVNYKVFKKNYTKNKLFNSLFNNELKFKNYYCTHPNYAKKYIKSENYILFIPYLPLKNKNLTSLDMPNNNDAIFLNQNYNIDIEAIISIISSFHDVEKIYLKLHPNNTIEHTIEIEKKIKDKNIIILKNKYISAEDIIQSGKPKYVISLNSTSLILSKMISQNTIPISITPTYIKLTGINHQIIEDHNILKQFDFILFK